MRALVLSDRQVIRMHQLSAEGFKTKQIADMLEISKNTVIEHLAFRVPYTPAILRKIACFPHEFTLPKENPLTIYNAAIYLPGWPERAKLFQLYRNKVLKAKIKRRGPWRGLVVSHAEIKRAALRMLPPGIWIRLGNVASYTNRNIAEECKKFSIGCNHMLHLKNKVQFVDIRDVVEQCVAREVPLNIPARTIHRALAAVDMTTVATI